AHLDAGRQRVIDDPGIKLPGEIGRIDSDRALGFAFATFPADGHEIDRIAYSIAAGASRQAAGERLQGRIGEPAWRRVAPEAIVDQHTRAVRDFEIIAKVAFEDPRKNVCLGRDNVAERAGSDPEPRVAIDRDR